ncbi:hypothetical protein VTH06DRAFT_2845 [Thermothelomyces fergusii]
MTPVTPHSVVQPLPPPHTQPYGDDRRHMSFDNGPQPPVYSRQPSYQPQTPLPHPQPYDYPPQYPSHGELYQIQVATAPGKRKAQRASQACDMCRQLKAKCDELKPCKSCKEKKLTASTGRLPRNSKTKSLQTSWMLSLERAIVRIGASLDVPAELQDDDERPESAESAAPTAEDAGSSSPGDMAGTQAPIGSQEARTITRSMEEEKEVEPGPAVPPGSPSIPVNHTTLAAFLLKWRPISVLVRDILEAENIKYVDEFPIRQEEKRGLLRVWGRGEGLESSLRVDKVDRESLRDAGVVEVTDDVSEIGAPSPGDCWGGIGSSPAPIDGKPVISLPTPDFSEALVWKYVKSFQDNIQNMHPLIIPRELNAMVKLFLDTVQQTIGKQPRGTVIAKFATAPSSQPETGSKRKRSSPGPEGPEPSLASPKSYRPVFQRSINNALVLLVLALGKICLHKDKIPDVVPVSEPPAHGSPMARNGYPASPIQGSSPSQASHSHSSAGLPSPKDSTERPGLSRRSSFQGGGASIKGGTSPKRNMDVIPGLDYFAYATDILGGQLAGTSLRHIHAFLLAGLYQGQLGRVLESYAYIKEAGFALQMKLRPSLDRFRRLNEMGKQDAVTEKSDNQLVFAFWTCLQLESDIIAELPLPQSQILAYEDIMPYPNIQVAKGLGFDEHVLQSYLAQLYLRKTLNQIHGMLYNPEKPLPLDVRSGAANIIEYIQETMHLSFVPPEFMFKPTDPPASDILSARLRAKYWGAQVITYRPFVRQILEFNFQKIANDTPLPASDFRSGVVVPVIGPDNDIPPQMIEYARKGVGALIESTRAFHGLKEKRFIVTNIFGTAHAQWGNLLTLAAAFRDPILNKYINEDLLKELFAKTIAFFRIIAPPSSALHIDLRILEGLQRKLWGNSSTTEAVDHPTGSSFSSSASSGPPPPVPPMAPAPSVPPVAGPAGIRSSPGDLVNNGIMSMSPQLPSPLAATMPGSATPLPMSPLEPGQGQYPGGMLPPMQPQPPHH